MKRNKPFVSFQAHPPERKTRSTTLTVHGSCCCCCLHSIGGIAGSIYGSMRRNAPEPDSLTTPEAVRIESEVQAAHRGTVKVYWRALTLIASIALAVLLLVNLSDQAVAPFLTLFFLPGGQLLATVVTALWIKMRPPVRKAEAYRRLIRITVFGFLGGLIGVIGVVIFFLTLSIK